MPQSFYLGLSAGLIINFLGDSQAEIFSTCLPLILSLRLYLP